MNSVHISGLVKGEAQVVKDNGIVRTVTILDNKQNSKEFKIHSPAGEYGDKLAGIPSGKRLILEGRLSSEELEENSGLYQGVVSLTKTIAVTDASSGQDYAKGYISGLATAEAMRTTDSGTAIANLNIKNTRTFYSKKQNKEISLSTYVNAVVWTDKAKAIQAQLPIKDVFVEASGMLVPSEFPSKKFPGKTGYKIEVWVDEISIGGVSATPSESTPAAPKAPRPAPKTRTKGASDDMDF